MKLYKCLTNDYPRFYENAIYYSDFIEGHLGLIDSYANTSPHKWKCMDINTELYISNINTKALRDGQIYDESFLLEISDGQYDLSSRDFMKITFSRKIENETHIL